MSLVWLRLTAENDEDTEGNEPEEKEDADNGDCQ